MACYSAPLVDNFTTTSNDWTAVYSWNTKYLITKAMTFTADTNALAVRILKSSDGGYTYDPEPLIPEFTIPAGSTVTKFVGGYQTSLQIQVKPVETNEHGTLSTVLIGTSLSNGGVLGSITNGDVVPIDAVPNTFGGYAISMFVDSNIVTSHVQFTAVGNHAQYDAVGNLVEIPNWALTSGRAAVVRDIQIAVNNPNITPTFEVFFYRSHDVTVADDGDPWIELAEDWTKFAGSIVMSKCFIPDGLNTIEIARAGAYTYLPAIVTCAPDSSSIWVKLRLLDEVGVQFSDSPGDTIMLTIVRELL